MFKMGMVQFALQVWWWYPPAADSAHTNYMQLQLVQNHGFWVHATFRMGDEREDSSFAGQASLQLTLII
jgi:hypothetical protein